MRLFHRLMLQSVLAVVAHPRLTLAISGIILAICSLLAWRSLPISTDQNKLFSSNVKFFGDFLEFNQKFPENEAIYVIIEPKDPATAPPLARWTATADAITARLQSLPQYVRSVDDRVPLDQLGSQGLLFDEPAHLPDRLSEFKRFGPEIQLWGEQPAGTATPPLQRFFAGRLLRFKSPIAAFRPQPEEARFVSVLADSWTRAIEHSDIPMQPGQALPDLAAIGADDPEDLGYYYVPDESDPTRQRRLLLVRVYPKQNFTALTAISKIVGAIRTAVADAAKPFPEFQIGLTGRPALAADEMRTTHDDSDRSEIVALIAVFIGLVIMFRSVWLAFAAELCLGVGIGWTFGWATLSVGELNLLSIVFLIALIGIGMDYLVQILMRYRHEAARRSDPAKIWMAVFKHIAPPINTACFGAAAAFLVALLTHFKGAADLGVIAGGGLLLCLLSGYTVLPALLVLFPAKPRPAPAKAVQDIPTGPEPRRRWLILPSIWAVALLVMTPFMMRAEFDPGLLNLQAPNLESVQLVRKLQTWSAVVLTKDLDVMRQARKALQGAPTVEGMESILGAYDNSEWLRRHAGELPVIQWSDPAPVKATDISSLASQARALSGSFESAGQRAGQAAAPTSAPSGQAELADAGRSLRAFADRLASIASGTEEQKQQAAGRLSAWQVGFIGQLREALAQFNPGDVRIADLPVQLRSHLVSDDGTYALYVYPKEDLWKRRNLARFVNDVERRTAQEPGAPAPTGIAINIFHSTNSIEKAFYRATAYALGLIILLVLIDLRRIGQTLLAISVLAFGLPMLVALMGWLDISWNFANFFGLPILIGAGHEYGVFMVHRYREALHDPIRRAWRGWDVSDRALLLCAFITSSSFGFFWALGHHEGLRSLGLVMALGTACIYAATLAVLRPLLRWKLARRAK